MGELVPWASEAQSHWGPSEKPYELTLEPSYQKMEAWGVYPLTPIPR